MNQVTDDANHSSKLKLTAIRLHFFYVVLILAGCLIVLATRNWTKLDGFTDYLSVSATLTSLVLGVVAIIYGFVSSNATNNFLGSVEASAREMKSVGSELRLTLSKGQELQTKAQDRNEELHILIGSLRTTVESLSTNTTNIAGAVESIPLKIDSLRSELLDKATSPSPAFVAPSSDTPLNTDQIISFLSQSSVLGLSALRALYEATVRTRPCDLGLIFKGIYHDNYDYIHGYLIACSCLGLVEFTLDSGTRTAAKITFHKDLGVEALIDKEWKRREEFGGEPAKTSIKKYTAQINASFSTAAPTETKVDDA